MKNRPVTLITGSRKGIGRYLVGHYVKLGHTVIGCSRGSPDWREENYTHYELDVTNEKQVQGLFVEIASKHQRLDHLLNNAGIASMNHILLTPVSTVESIMNTNFLGTFLFCREAVRLMMRNRYGRIINFSTIATHLNLEGEAIYAASKAAVTKFSEILAREVAPMGITVNTIAPTPLETDLTKNVPPDKMKNVLGRQAIPRFGIFEDISNVTDFYLQSESGFITGQTLYLGGC